jgi:hypothetical protein
MKVAQISIGVLILSWLLRSVAVGQVTITHPNAQTETIIITEPPIFKLETLFKTADVVAVVRIVSGDTENYKTTIYKAVVVQSFKGTADGNTLYFGPFIGYRLGREYVAFLCRTKDPAVPTTTPTAAYGPVKYLEVFDDGYSSMEASYECVFDEKNIDKECDDGVKVCTDYIVLPKGTPAFPSMDEIVPFGCRWVRRSKFMRMLEKLARPPEPQRMP